MNKCGCRSLSFHISITFWLVLILAEMYRLSALFLALFIQKESSYFYKVVHISSISTFPILIILFHKFLLTLKIDHDKREYLSNVTTISSNGVPGGVVHVRQVLGIKVFCSMFSLGTIEEAYETALEIYAV